LALTRFVPNLFESGHQNTHEVLSCADKGDAPTRKKRNKFTLKLRREVGDVLPCMLSDDDHLSQMGLGGDVHFETVLVTTLLFADLAVPPQALQALRFHFVRHPFGRSNYNLSAQRFRRVIQKRTFGTRHGGRQSSYASRDSAACYGNGRWIHTPHTILSRGIQTRSV
jgi:hypothetical protein